LRRHQIEYAVYCKTRLKAGLLNDSVPKSRSKFCLKHSKLILVDAEDHIQLVMR
jgi:hypothetical protein